MLAHVIQPVCSCKSQELAQPEICTSTYLSQAKQEDMAAAWCLGPTPYSLDLLFGAMGGLCQGQTFDVSTFDCIINRCIATSCDVVGKN